MKIVGKKFRINKIFQQVKFKWVWAKLETKKRKKSQRLSAKFYFACLVFMNSSDC